MQQQHTVGPAGCRRCLLEGHQLSGLGEGPNPEDKPQSRRVLKQAYALVV